MWSAELQGEAETGVLPSETGGTVQNTLAFWTQSDLCKTPHFFLKSVVMGLSESWSKSAPSTVGPATLQPKYQ